MAKFKYNYKLHFLSSIIVFISIILGKLFIYMSVDRVLFDFFGNERNRSSTLAFLVCLWFFQIVIIGAISFRMYEIEKSKE